MKKSSVIIATILATLIVVFFGVLIWMYSGVFNVSTMDDDWVAKTWFFETVKTQSIAAHAEDIDPPQLTEPMAVEGATHFQQMCARCHGAPGVEPHEWAKRLHPDPPPLSDEAEEYSAAEVFWIVKHGIEMSGMPAWGFESDEELWKVVAFVERLPGMTRQEYRRMLDAGGAHGHGHGGEHHTRSGQHGPDDAKGAAQQQAGDDARATVRQVRSTSRDITARLLDGTPEAQIIKGEDAAEEVAASVREGAQRTGGTGGHGDGGHAP